MQPQLIYSDFRSYLQKPYSFFVKTNSSILIRNVYSEIGIFTYQIIVALSILINDLILKSGFIIDSQTKYENGLISIKFIRDE